MANLANRLQFAKLKPSKLVVTIDNPLADLFIRQTFFRQTLEKSRFTKHSARQTFPLYGKYNDQTKIVGTIYIIGFSRYLNSMNFADLIES